MMKHPRQTPSHAAKRQTKSGHIIGALAGCVTPNAKPALSRRYRVDSPFKNNRLLVISALVAFVATSGFAQSDPEFAKANDEFAKGDFKAAISDYEALVHAKQWSAPLFYNLGNAYFRAGDFGKSILNYERALALDPHQPEAAANIVLVREEARALELQRNGFDSALKHVSATPVTIAAAVGFWVLLFGVILRIFSRQRSVLPMTLATLGCLVAVVSAAVVYRIETTRSNLGVITGHDTRARLATADNASTVLQLPPGSEVQILSRRGEWMYAALPNNLKGWLPSSSVESVRL